MIVISNLRFKYINVDNIEKYIFKETLDQKINFK